MIWKHDEFSENENHSSWVCCRKPFQQQATLLCRMRSTLYRYIFHHLFSSYCSRRETSNPWTFRGIRGTVMYSMKLENSFIKISLRNGEPKEILKCIFQCFHLLEHEWTNKIFQLGWMLSKPFVLLMLLRDPVTFFLGLSFKGISFHLLFLSNWCFILIYKSRSFLFSPILQILRLWPEIPMLQTGKEVL